MNGFVERKYSARVSEMFRLLDGAKQDIDTARVKLAQLEGMIMNLDPLEDIES